MAVTTVSVEGSVYSGDGVPIVSGTIVADLSQPAAAADGSWVVGRVIGTITAGVVSSLELAANDVLTPAGTYWSVKIGGITADGQPYQSPQPEKWQLASTPSPISIGAVPRLGVYVPAPSLAIPVPQAQGGTGLAAANGGFATAVVFQGVGAPSEDPNSNLYTRVELPHHTPPGGDNPLTSGIGVFEGPNGSCGNIIAYGYPEDHAGDYWGQAEMYATGGYASLTLSSQGPRMPAANCRIALDQGVGGGQVLMTERERQIAMVIPEGGSGTACLRISSPNGTLYRVTVSDGGVLTVAPW